MKNIFATLLFTISCSISFAQLNIEFRSKLDFGSLHNAELNDVWGYVDEVGNEYAIVGTTRGTSVVDVTDPDNPVEVFWEPGVNSTWRDIKTNGDYAYVTTEGGDGLLIIDLSPLPASTALTTTQYFGPSGNRWQSAHNLFIDSSGYAYIYGANRGNGGVIMLDVFTDPINPIEVGVFDNWYVHDGVVYDSIMYSAHVSNGFFSVVDIKDKSNPIVLGTKSTPNNFAHNIWVSDDRKVVFTTDEKKNAFITSYDVSDPSNIVELDRIQSNPGSQVIPHNAHVLGNYVVTSYYRDGVTIHDATRPGNMVEVGNYDSSPLSGDGFNGCWGAYPYLPSGNILISDIESGLHVLAPTYVRAGYVEGTVTDAVSGNPIFGASVKIQSINISESTRTNGVYGLGTLEEGNFAMVVSKVGYENQTIQVDILSANVTVVDVELVPLVPFDVTFYVFDIATGDPINSADVRIEHIELTANGTTNGLGEEDLTLFYEGDYRIYAGKWGYTTGCEDRTIDMSSGMISLGLNKGIFDDFTFDNSWSVSGTATTGIWERGIPIGGNGSANPEFDAEYDCSKYAFVTGNKDTFDPDEDDVDNGTARLQSPVFSLVGYSDPYINYSRYFYNFFGPNGAPDDELRIFIMNGQSTVLMEEVSSDPAIFYKWINQSKRVSDYLTPTADMRVLIITSDQNPNFNITEAGFDYFHVTEGSSADILENTSLALKVYPNPAQDMVTIEGLRLGESFVVYSAEGKPVLSQIANKNAIQLNINSWASGVYFLRQAETLVKIVKSEQ